MLVATLAILSLDLHLARGSSRGDAPTVACVKASTSSRYVPYGYNHVVTLANTCVRDARCSVATDVAPDPQSVEVPKGGTVDVVTFVASPSQTFTARVSCTLE